MRICAAALAPHPPRLIGAMSSAWPARPCASFACCSCSTSLSVLHSLRSSARRPWLAPHARGNTLAPARLPGAVRRSWRTGLDASMRCLNSPSMARRLRPVCGVARGWVARLRRHLGRALEREAKRRKPSETKRSQSNEKPRSDKQNAPVRPSLFNCSLLSSHASTVLGLSRPSPLRGCCTALTALRSALVGTANSDPSGSRRSGAKAHAH